MVEIVRVTAEQATVYRSVRLESLRESPTAFGSKYEIEAAFDEGKWRERIATLDGERGIGFIAIRDGAGCGIVVGLLHAAEASPSASPGFQPSHAMLHGMWVDPAARRHGVGAALVRAVTDWAAAQGAPATKLAVTENNERAIRLYEGLGFEATGESEPYANDPSLRLLEMARSEVPVVVRAALPMEWGRVNDFYASEGRTVRALEGERWVIAERADRMIGTLRLCEEEGQQVLRTVHVSEPERRRGIGKRMLAVTEPMISGATCHCLPYRHLEDFYGRIGFEAIPIEDAPPHLRHRLAGYLSEGREMVVMRRLATP
jgi:ribosomal protein S18 acetylase RimI-like enzyme